MVQKVHEYRTRIPKLSYRKIAKILKRDVKQIYRWAKTIVDSYPQKDSKC